MLYNTGQFWYQTDIKEFYCKQYFTWAVSSVTKILKPLTLNSMSLVSRGLQMDCSIPQAIKLQRISWNFRAQTPWVFINFRPSLKTTFYDNTLHVSSPYLFSFVSLSASLRKRLQYSIKNRKILVNAVRLWLWKTFLVARFCCLR